MDETAKLSNKNINRYVLMIWFRQIYDNHLLFSPGAPR